MKAIRKIRSRVRGAANYCRQPSRLRHFRGHGVHSPFVYGLIRNAFMKPLSSDGDRSLYDYLRLNGVNRYWARQIQNLHNYCECDQWCPSPRAAGGARVLLVNLPEQVIDQEILRRSPQETILVILSPLSGRARKELTNRLISVSGTLSIDNRGFTVLFYNFGLPVRHYKL